MELLLAGISAQGVVEKIGRRLPPSVVKYFFCSPDADLALRCLPSAGGMYQQRLRDIVEFTIIENRIRSVQKRRESDGHG